MAKKESIKQIWSDPKDFGLPPVDITPLGNPELKKIDRKVASNVKEDTSPTDMINAAKVEAIKKAKISKEVAEEREKVSESNSKTVTSQIESDKKSNSWVVLVLLVGLAIVSMIIWQLFMDKPATETQLKEIAEVEKESVKNVTPELSVKNDAGIDSVQGTSTDNISLEDEKVEQKESSLVESSKNTESGTTIENKERGELIRVETKPNPSQYFIIVGSLPTERLALAEASNYWNRVDILYLLSPTEDSKNYRLAIGQFSGFTPANAELQRVKDDYKEALWILKY